MDPKKKDDKGNGNGKGSSKTYVQTLVTTGPSQEPVLVECSGCGKQYNLVTGGCPFCGRAGAWEQVK